MKGGFVATDREKFEEFFKCIDHATLIVEASSTIDRIVAMLPNHELRVANPYKVRLIAESMNKTDKNDVNISLDLYRRSYMQESYISPDDIRESRNICRNGYFLVMQRTPVKNRIRDQAYRLDMDFRGLKCNLNPKCDLMFFTAHVPSPDRLVFAFILSSDLSFFFSSFLFLFAAFISFFDISPSCSTGFSANS